MDFTAGNPLLSSFFIEQKGPVLSSHNRSGAQQNRRPERSGTNYIVCDYYIYYITSIASSDVIQAEHGDAAHHDGDARILFPRQFFLKDDAGKQH